MDAPAPPLAPCYRPHPARTIALLLVGVAAYLALQQLGSGRRAHTTFDPTTWVVIGVTAVLAFIPGVAAHIAPFAAALNSLLSTYRRFVTILIALFAAVVLLASALYEHRDFFPRNHDEHMYLIQAQQLAHFRLWLPQHELADFFETFHVLVKPKYASIYFPGASLLYVASIWLHVPTWIESLLICGLIVGLTYRVTAELLDDTSGLLAAAMICALPRFRQFSLMIMSHTVVLLLGLLMLYAYLKWRRAAFSPVSPRRAAQRFSFAALLGILTSWAAITRPMDALCFAIPIGIAFLLDLRHSNRKAVTLLVAVLAALPLLSLQLIADYGITGHPLKLPASLFAERYWPELGMGYHPYQPNRVPPTPLGQFHDYYKNFIQPRVQAHQPANAWHVFITERLPMTLITDLPSKAMTILLPVGLLGLTTRPRRALVSTWPLFLALYTPFLFFLQHYTVPVVPALLLLTLLGRRALTDIARAAGVWSASAILAFSAIALASPSTKPLGMFNTLRDVREKLDKIPGRAVVLFRYDVPDDPPQYLQEPVYNVDTMNIDDARIIRAHDLGPARDEELFRYYRQRQPDRQFYLYDRATHTLTKLEPTNGST